jgi:hypothetical protein
VGSEHCPDQLHDLVMLPCVITCIDSAGWMGHFPGGPDMRMPQLRPLLYPRAAPRGPAAVRRQVDICIAVRGSHRNVHVMIR